MTIIHIKNIIIHTRLKEKHWGEKHLKKRGLASLFIVSIIAIAAVVGVVFAFRNSGRQTDVYASATIVADKSEINLNVEVVEDPSVDNGLMIAETESSYDYVTVTVGGLPSTASRRVRYDEEAVTSGLIKVEEVSNALEAEKTGVNVFKVIGKNGGAPIDLVFTGVGDLKVKVKVTVNMVAKYMQIGKSAKGDESHFGVRAGNEEPVNLKSAEILSKFAFYAHKSDVKKPRYTPNQFPVIYRLKEKYEGVTLTENGFLTVSENANCVDQYIYLQAQLPAMAEDDEWIDVKFYVFPAAQEIIIKSAAWQAEGSKGKKEWDLIKNRKGTRSSANFTFELDNMPTLSDYGLKVDSSDSKLVSVYQLNAYTWSLSSAENLGEAEITVVAYPIVRGENGEADIEFAEESDRDVWIPDTFRLRVRNEFYLDRERAEYGESYNLKIKTDNKDVNNQEYLNAFFYEGGYISDYYDIFSVDTGNGQVINIDADVEFELLVEDSTGEYTGTFNRNGFFDVDGNAKVDSNGTTMDLFDVLEMRYWAAETETWVPMTKENYSVNYLNKFSVAFKRSIEADNLISDNISSLTLRVKSVSKMSVGDYASYDIKLDPTYAIDNFEMSNLTQFDEDNAGVALVYDTNTKEFSTVKIQVKGVMNNGTPSQSWNTAKVVDNRNKLPFNITSNNNVQYVYKGTPGYYCIEYTFTAESMESIEYYKDYPMTITYPNGVSTVLNVRVYPTVESLSMSVVSGSRGKIYKTLTKGVGYKYVRTVYVRKGYDYQFAIDTPSVNVGAYAEFTRVVSHDTNKVIAENTKVFDTTDLDEGLYECTVNLKAYSQDVYGNHDTEITVYVVVVDPVGNVAPISDVVLDGIDDSDVIALNLTDLDRKVITDTKYLHIDLVQTNENIVIDEHYGAFNQYKITAKYLYNNPIKIGFKIYKSYFFEHVDLDGDNQDDTEPFVFNYIAGSSITATVKINKEKPNALIVTGNDYTVEGGDADGYLKLVSSSNEANFTITGSVVDVIKTEARNKKIGITYAQWENGKFQIEPFAYARWIQNGEFTILPNTMVTVGGVATVELASPDARKITVTPIAGKTSLAKYAVVVYPCDSLHYVKTQGDTEYALPDLSRCKIVSLYIGDKSDIEKAIADKKACVIHDANSGKCNSLGGYNWIIPAQNTDGTYSNSVAALTYTATGNSSGSQIQANKYYFDDLYTVLGWEQLGYILDLQKVVVVSNINKSIAVTKHVIRKINGEVTEEKKTYNLPLFDNNGSEPKATRLTLDLSDENYGGTANYSQDANTIVYFDFVENAMSSTFYVVDGFKYFDVHIISENSRGLVARRDLSPEEFTQEFDSITMQRGNGFEFGKDVSFPARWELDTSSFDNTDKTKTSTIEYQGGIYEFFPYVELERPIKDGNGVIIGWENNKFVLDALNAKVKVDVKGGVNYLNIVQDSITLDGASSASYDVTVRTDRPWSSDLLTFTFLYDGVYYELFAENPNIAYINLEGGKAKLEFKLTCLNPSAEVQNFYSVYFLRIDVAVVITAPDVDPFYDISGSRLFVTENLAGSTLAKTKTPAVDSATFNLIKQGVYNLTIAHFAETNPVDGNKSALTLTTGQTNTGVIYLDSNSAGGLLKVHPTPYYINVTDISIATASDGYHTEMVQIGTDLSGKPIYDTVTYSIGFVQMIYNEDEGYFQPYLTGAGKPKMVSSWSRLEGYKWTGDYWFKTKLVTNSQIAYRLPNGTRFKIEVSIKGESNPKAITETMVLDARYRDSFVIDPSTDTEDYAVRTMLQTQYQALGTTAVYDIAFPTDCVPNFAGFTFNGVSSTSATIKSNLGDVTINSVNQTLTVRLNPDVKLINQTLEIRIPYTRPGDYVNPYLSVVIVPVYFKVNSLEIVDHYESRVQVATYDDLLALQYRAVFEYNTAVANSTIIEKMNDFNASLLNSSSLNAEIDAAHGQASVKLSYTYENGVPVLGRNTDCRLAQTFNYELKQADALVKHTEYLAVGTSATYTFRGWSALHGNKLKLIPSANNDVSIQSEFWNYAINSTKVQNGYDVAITISLENRSKTISDNTAYDTLINAGRIVVNVISTADSSQPQMELTIIPVYFTFGEFKLQNNPMRPLVALSNPTTVTIEAGSVKAVANDSDVTTAINAFNEELLAAQNNLNSNAILTFSRVPNSDGILNFDFNSKTRALTRADLSKPITATSYLMVTANFDYVNGKPTLNRNGKQKITTYLPVQTFGEENGNSNGSITDLQPAPNGRVRTIPQAIGTKVRYNVALPNTNYDSKLDKYEVRADNTYTWQKDFHWNATLNTKENVITVTLDEKTNLFNKTLVILAYNQEGELMYKLNIIPAYFTVEQILLADHIDENPVLIKIGDANWLQNLVLDYKTTHSTSSTFANFDFDTYIENFRQSLNNSSLVIRIDDSNYVTVLAGVNYENGIPTIGNSTSSATTIQNTYRYEMYEGIPHNTKAQAIGFDVVYNVNRLFQSIKIGRTVNGVEIWEPYVDGSNWTVEKDVQNARCVKVHLDADEDLIRHPIHIGIFVQDSNEEPDYILNIVPAYFTVDDLTVKDQNNEDRNIYMYYGVKPDSPKDLTFDPIFGQASWSLVYHDKQGESTVYNGLNLAQCAEIFKEYFQGEGSNKIARDYDSSMYSGDLRVSAYLDYTTGTPVLVSKSESETVGDCLVRVDVDFWYAIFGRGNEDGKYPSMPTGPRTRTAVQAVGTTATYKIDLNKTLSMDMDVLVYDENSLAERGWKATFADNVLTLELLSDETSVRRLLVDKVDGTPAEDLVFKFYAGSSTVFVLTVQPVLFEVVGVETYTPSTPVSLFKKEPTDIRYRAVVKYNDNVKFKASDSATAEDISNFIESFNTRLNNEGLLDIEKVEFDGQGTGKYLKLTAAVDYGDSASEYRRSPKLLDVENNPLNTIQNYIEYVDEVNSGITTSAKHYQAVGTTEYYHLGAAFKDITNADVTVSDTTNANVTVVKNHGSENETVLKVVLAKNSAIVNTAITVEVKYNIGTTTTPEIATLTMTIQPTWFVVEGFEVVNHPEQHMWLIISNTNEEKVSDLKYRARVRYAMDASSALADTIQSKINAFNEKLATTGDSGWADLIDTETIGGQYLVVRAAVVYDEHGEASVTAIDENNMESTVRDIFKYVRYSNKVKGNSVAYPNVPRSRTVEITIGYAADYTLDIPEFGSFTDDLIALYYNGNKNYADDDKKLERYNGNGAWHVSVNGNVLHVELDADIALASQELKVFIYKNKNLVPGANEKPDSYDKERIAFILTIHPVLYKVTDFALSGYNDDEIHVTDIGTFTKNLSQSNGYRFVPVFEYAQSLLDTTVNGKTVKAMMEELSTGFSASKYVSKTRTSAETGVYYFQVTTSVNYKAYEGTPEWGNDPEYRIWKTFRVVVDNGINSFNRDEYQAIGSTKTYYIDDSVFEGVGLGEGKTMNQAEGTLSWNHNSKNYVTITLNHNLSVDTVVEFQFTAQCKFTIHPVYYEVLGFEPVEHPERAAWIIDQETTDDLQYRMITTDISFYTGDTLTAIKANIDNWNQKLNIKGDEGAHIEISLTDSQFIIVDGAVNYTAGYPEFVEINKDKRNIVESVIKYRIWSASQVPNPEHPSVMGRLKVNQVIGKTKSYTLRNIRGQVSYPYLWVEGAGSLKSGFDNSSDGTTAVYEKLTIVADVGRNILRVQLPADSSILKNNIYVYIPYLTTVNGREIWYSYCIEITPLLFELRGWTIEGVGVPSNELYIHPDRADCLLLTPASKVNNTIRYVAMINVCKNVDAKLQNMIDLAKSNLEALAGNYIMIDNPANNIGFEGYTLIRYVGATDKTDTILNMSTYINYRNGIPELVDNSNTLVSNQVLVSTGYTIDEWKDHISDIVLSSDNNYSVQALGTSATYSVEISDAAKIFTDRIQVVERGTNRAITIPGERSNLVKVTVDDIFDENFVFTVDLAPVVALRDHLIEIRIPYAEDLGASTPTNTFKYYITPALFSVDGFYLAAAENNYLNLGVNDVVMELHAVVSYSDDISIRNMVNLMLQSFENSLNNAINNQNIKFNVVNVNGGINVAIEQHGNQVLIQKLNDIDALNYITSNIRVGYAAGIPTVGGVDPMTDTLIGLQIQVETLKGEVGYFAGWENTQEGQVEKFVQSIGTSRDYHLLIKDDTIIFYPEYIEIFNGGLKNGFNSYEFFAYNVVMAGRRDVTVGVTLRASARNLNDYIDIRIPYTRTTEKGNEWFYYSLKVKPVLFEIKAWKVKIDGETTDTVVLDNASVILKYTPEVITGPLNLSYYSAEDLAYVKNSLTRLEEEINTYDIKYADGYTYLVIQNRAQEGTRVNYSFYRDGEVTYLQREIGEAATTVMQVSATVSYGINSFDKQYVAGAKAITSYEGELVKNGKEGSEDYNDQYAEDEYYFKPYEDVRTITSNISIVTTDKTLESSMDDHSKVYISQSQDGKEGNAERLMALSSGVDYILMSDIYISKISDLKNGKWKPAAFPEDTTLDGNNFKIIFDMSGFDLENDPENIGLFTSIPAGSVVKNLQIVFARGTTSAPITTLTVDLTNYEGDKKVSVGMLAGVNNGIISNCAVVPQWQFEQPGLSEVKNEINNQYLKDSLPFNKDGYLIDDEYFYEIDTNEEGKLYIKNYFNKSGYRLSKNAQGQWGVYDVDMFANIDRWISPDRTNVAKYENYSAMNLVVKKGTNGASDNKFENSGSTGRLLIKANNDQMDVTVGGLVGANLYMITNSRVLIDVELDGPKKLTTTSGIEEKSVMNSIVGGVVGVNNGTITSTFFRDANVTNNANANNLGDNKGVSMLGGFVGQNTGTIIQSYAMGASVERDPYTNYISEAGYVHTIRNSLGGFAHANSGTIKDCLVNMVIWKTGTEGSAGGFVYQNLTGGVIENCIENNNVILQPGSTWDFYSAFVASNNGAEVGTVDTVGLYNLIFAGNAVRADNTSDDWGYTLKRLDNNTDSRYVDINKYNGFSIGQASNWEISDKNTVWKMTDKGPMLREANEIAVSYRKTTLNWSPYLYNPGTKNNPYLIWNEKQFNNYTYAATAGATQGDKDNGQITSIEGNRNNNHLRMVDNIVLSGIKDTYKVIYTGTIEGNGLTMSGINLDTVTNDLATMGLFGKTEYATIRNINFEIGGINATARYVGGIAGIAINTNFVDVNVKSTGLIKGANIVGGVAGLAVIFNPKESSSNSISQVDVENYNVHSEVSVTANFHNQQTDVGAEFATGLDYYRQTLYAKVEGLNMSYERGYGAAGGIYGFVTSNPNTYRVETKNDNNVTMTEIKRRNFEKEIVQKDAAGTVYNVVIANSNNSEEAWFMKNQLGERVDVDSAGLVNNYYYTGKVVLNNMSGSLANISGNVAGGLIGVMDETVELKKPSVTALTSLSGKYYLGGIVGINLGKISGEAVGSYVYGAMTLNSWSVLSSAGTSYIYRANPSQQSTDGQRYWGMTVGGIAGYNDGFESNPNSGLIENININVNVLSGSSSVYQLNIGGIVGGNGTYGKVTNSTNTHSAINISATQIGNTLGSRVGMYFGRTVGYCFQSVAGGERRMPLLTVDFPNITANRIITTKDGKSTNNFYTPNNQWKISSTTLKKQTMTQDEYFGYLLSELKKKDLPGRIELLNDWVVTLPTYITYEWINGKYVWVEKYDDTEVDVIENGVTKKVGKLQQLINWVNGSTVGGTLNDHTPVFSDRGGNTTLGNYQDYLMYSAIGDNNAMPNDAVLAAARQKRYADAITFFTYQDAITRPENGINGEQNRKFTWQQYMDYQLLEKAAENGGWFNYIDGNVDYSKSNYDKNKEQFTNAFTKQDDTKEFVGNYELFDMIYVNAFDKETSKLTGYFGQYNSNGTISYVKSMDGYKRLFNAEMTDEKRFTDKDPLQIYLNYVVGQKTGATQINGKEISFQQYYYYVANIFNSDNLIYTEGGKNIVYNAPNDFSGLVENIPASYVLYVYTNDKDLKGSSAMLTVPQFIYLLKNENDVVMAKETNWITTGHLGGNDVRVSSIGAVDLNWSSAPISENDINVSNGIIALKGNGNENKKWEALTNYLTARSSMGLTITKYNEIINLGGSLYELLYKGINTDGTYINSKYNGVATGTEDYIFDLKSKQYQWSDEQIEFIKKNFYDDKNNKYDLNYALSATIDGNILSFIENGKGGLRAVYANKTQKMIEDDIFTDQDGDGAFVSGEPITGTVISTHADTVFKNGNGGVYYVYGTGSVTIDLKAINNEQIKQGAAFYIDTDDNKLFGTSSGLGTGSTFNAGTDILAIYELEAHEVENSTGYAFYTWLTNNGLTQNNGTDKPTGTGITELRGYYSVPDFYTKDKDGKINGYFKIARQIVANDGHKMTTGVTSNNNGQIKTEYTGNKSDYLEEAAWWRSQGFNAEQFDQIKNHAMVKSLTGGYVEFGADGKVTGRAVGYTLADDWTATVDNDKNSGFVTDSFTPDEYTEIVMGAKFTDGIWYSTYADYQLFKMLNNSTEYKNGIVKNDVVNGLPDSSKNAYKHPWSNKALSVSFLGAIATESELAEAMEFNSDRAAFLALFRAGSSTAEYVEWSKSFNYVIKNEKEPIVKKFRLNHYIYFKSKKLDEKKKIDGTSDFDAEDFQWVLNQNYRREIQYEGVTQEKRTTDMVEYRMNWITKRDGKEVEFITFRDYCEWINVYAYSSAYKAARGDYEDVETGETLKSTDGWLTIEAFAVWKRMEKYENNIEYLNKVDTTATQQVITAPILKRKISTTVFPMIQMSGEQQKNSDGIVEDETYTLVKPGEKASSYYGWNSYGDNKDHPMDESHARSYLDRYEYNERYVIRKIKRVDSDAKALINDSKWVNDATAEKTKWSSRYGAGADYLKLDEIELNGEKPKVDTANKGQYAQLYIPYDYFEAACKMIKSVYSETNGYAGYHQYMKYWARNGQYFWICDQSAFPGELDKYKKVNNVYTVTKFWDNYNGTLNPQNGDTTNATGYDDVMEGTNPFTPEIAYGWRRGETD